MGTWKCRSNSLAAAAVIGEEPSIRSPRLDAIRGAMRPTDPRWLLAPGMRSLKDSFVIIVSNFAFHKKCFSLGHHMTISARLLVSLWGNIMMSTGRSIAGNSNR